MDQEQDEREHDPSCATWEFPNWPCSCKPPASTSDSQDTSAPDWMQAAGILFLIILAGMWFLDWLSSESESSGGTSGIKDVDTVVTVHDPCYGSGLADAKIEAEIENNRNEGLDVNPLDFKLENPDGERFSYDQYGGFADELGPGGKTSGWVLFFAHWDDSYKGETWSIIYEPLYEGEVVKQFEMADC